MEREVYGYNWVTLQASNKIDACHSKSFKKI